MGTFNSRKVGEVLEDMVWNRRNKVKLVTMEHVRNVKMVIDCLVMKVDADGLLLDTGESKKDENGKLIYGWDTL